LAGISKNLRKTCKQRCEGIGLRQKVERSVLQWPKLDLSSNKGLQEGQKVRHSPNHSKFFFNFRIILTLLSPNFKSKIRFSNPKSDLKWKLGFEIQNRISNTYKIEFLLKCDLKSLISNTWWHLRTRSTLSSPNTTVPPCLASSGLAKS
jgi:hypothetical protein